MKINGEYGSGQFSRMYAAQSGKRSSRTPQKSESKPPEIMKTSRGKEQNDVVHNSDSLRAGVARLIESGDIDATTDGQVRTVRVEEARRNKEAGTYNRQEVIGRIVDRLLDHWNI